MWAEDGSVYATDAFHFGSVHTLLRGYAGYVQFLPRLLALVAVAAPIKRTSVVFAVAASLCCALLAVFVFRCTERWIESMALRLVVAAMVALVPAGAFETTANVANLGWPLLVGTFWAIVSRQRSVGDTALRAIVAVLTALTTTVAVVFAPLALGLSWYRRRRRDWIVAAAFGVALAVQLVLDLSASASPPRASSSWIDLPAVFGVRVLASMVFGERWLPDAWAALGFGTILLTLLVLAVVASLGIGQAAADRRWFALASLAMSFVLFAVPMWIRGTGYVHLGGAALNVNASRYVVAPIGVATSGLLVLVDASGRRWLRDVVATYGVLLLVLSLRMPTARSSADSWAAEAEMATRLCRAEPTLTTVRLPISPGPPWTVIVPCARLR